MQVTLPELPPKQQLLRSWSRDLSICTVEEMEARWRGAKRDAIHKIDPRGFDGRLLDHNPIFYLACRTFFSNTIDGVPAYKREEIVYPPLHRDKFCKEFLDYLIAPSGLDSGLLLTCQRDSLKSTFSQNAVPLWFWLRQVELYDRYSRIALLHFKEIQASINLVSLKNQLLSNPWMRRNWPERCSDRDFGTKTEFSFPGTPSIGAREHSMIARGLGASLVGLHFDLICFDDLVEESHRTSKTLRDDTSAKYDAVQYTLDTVRGKKIHTGTPYHPTDQWGRMIKANSEGKTVYRVVQIGAGKMEATGDGDVQFVDLSFPTRHSSDVLRHKRQEEMDRSGNDDFFQLQMLCELRSKRLLAADPAWLKEVPLKLVPPGGWRVIIVDPAWKGTENSGEGDSASIQAWELFRHGPWIVKYLLDGVHSNELTDREGKNEIFRLMNKWGIQDVAPEETGGHSFRTSLADEANVRGVVLNVINLKQIRTNKMQRITAFLSEVQAGRVFLVNECDPWLLAAFREQFINYPQVDHDDALDCAAYTSDPAIAESYAPYFNTLLTQALQRRQAKPALPPRTLHSGR